MRAFGPESLMRLSFALCIGIATAQGLQAATPGFTIKAGNVSVSGQGSGTSQFTVTSVGGYAGTVYVTCSGPDGNLLSDLLLPVCGSPVEEALPANGSVSGSMSFTPPSSVTSSAKLQGGPPGPPRPMPYVAGVLAGLGLLGLRMRRILDRRLAIVAGAICLAALAGIAGCLGRGGLAMSPGTYTYTISGNSVTVPISSASTTISVTVSCDSCP